MTDWDLIKTESVVLDERRYPLVVTQFIDTPTDSAIDLYLSRADRALEAGKPYALVVEANSLRDMSQAHRQKFADWLKRRRDDIERLCVGQAYVYGSVVQRMILRSVFMLSPLPTEHIIVKHRHEAESWCVQRLRDAGESVPPAPADWIRSLNG